MTLARILNFVLSHTNALYYRTKFKLLGKRVTIGRNFRIRGKLKIKGPGRVIIGNDVLIDGRGHPVTPFTYSKNAVIRIGDHSFLNGTRFGCQDEIDVGPYAILGDARILDTDFHSIEINRWSKDAAVLHAPIKIGKNCWVAAGAVILKGVEIGENSVIGFASVVTKDIPSNCVVAGNPAIVVNELT